ncbi:MAG: hypothetical protein OXF41_16390 [bacterium]|nr:hypothetical protein [bacterium]
MSSPEPDAATSPLPPHKGMADTPDLLADALVRAVGTTEHGLWLDPSAGSGRLIEAALRAGVPAKSILAIDLQANLPALDNLGVESLLSTDFLHWAQRTDRRFDRVIANPPFVRLRELQEALVRPALETRLDGLSIPRTANYWVAFLIAGMRLLKPGGSLAYVLPAAWEYANYAGPLRSMCESSFEELDVHRVSVPMFETVADGSVLLVGRGLGRQPRRRAHVINHPKLSALNQAVSASEVALTPKEMRSIEPCLPEGQVQFGEIAHIRIGAVTGHASYFLLNEEQRLALNLPCSAVWPVLSKAHHITGSQIGEHAWTKLWAAGERVWLFSPSDADLSHPSVRAYLDLPAEEGGCRREATKIRHRDPWYRVPIPEPFDGFLTGMSMARPWVALNRKPGLTASNTLYGVRFPTIASPDEQAAWCLSMLSSTTSKSRAQLVRRYPQGLLKLEPGDIARLAVRPPKNPEGALSLYHQAVELVMTGNAKHAQTLADEWLEA